MALLVTSFLCPNEKWWSYVILQKDPKDYVTYGIEGTNSDSSESQLKGLKDINPLQREIHIKWV